MRALALLALLSATALAEAPLRLSSGPTRVSLIELYTSEGCSSCPPADAWLGSLAGKEGLWTSFVPVEFHVNYWDQLGWKDRLASREFTDREYAYSRAWGSSSVYTPCFVRNGAEWRPAWGIPSRSADPAGVLELEVAADGTCAATFSQAGVRGPLQLHVALLGGGLTSKVTAGENDGRTLGHEFVVIGSAAADLTGDGRSLRGSVRLPQPSVPGAKRLAVAAWVTRPGELEPLQATGGWLPSAKG